MTALQPIRLPVCDQRTAIVAAVRDHGRLILSAPPGSGKSTQVPQFFLGQVSGRILVLQPRRIAARNLALRVARELGEEPGGCIGSRITQGGR